MSVPISFAQLRQTLRRVADLMSQNTKIGIVTAAGYTQAERYYGRLHGLLDAVKASSILTAKQKQNIMVMGGESNFLFKYDPSSPYLLAYVDRHDWILPAVSSLYLPEYVARYTSSMLCHRV